MCLAIPGKVIKIKNKNKAIVNFLGEEKEIDVSLVSNIKINDWLIVKQKLAINKIPSKDALEILEMAKHCHHDHGK